MVGFGILFIGFCMGGFFLCFVPVFLIGVYFGLGFGGCGFFLFGCFLVCLFIFGCFSVGGGMVGWLISFVRCGDGWFMLLF